MDTSRADDERAPIPLGRDGSLDLPVVYAATYDHLGVILWGTERLRRSLDEEVGRLERWPGFRVGWDHEAYTYDHLAENEPDLLAEMRQALDRFDGRLDVASCTYGQPLSVFIDGESNVRQLTMAIDTVERRLGRSPRVYLMSEHAFHAQLPQLLVGCGFTGAVLRTHFMMYGHNPEYDVPVGWWRGIDGSRIAALPTYRGQADTAARFRWKIPGPVCTLDNRILTDAISDRCALTLEEFRRRFGRKIRSLVATRADDPRSEESLIAAHADDPNVRWVLLGDVFGLLPAPQAELAPGPNEFRVRMPWGYCGNWIWRRCRQAEVRVETAERIAAVAAALGAAAREADLQAAWKHLLVAQHHDIQICGLEDDARHHLDECLRHADRAIEAAFDTVAPRIAQAGRPVAFNPLPWDRTEWVDLADGGCLVDLPALGFAAVAGEGAEPLPDGPAFSYEPHAQEETLCRVVRVPGGGPTAVRRDYDEVGCLRTPFYEAYTAATGGIRLLRSRRTGRDLLAPPNDSGTLAGLVDGAYCRSVGRWDDVRIERDRAVLVEQGRVGTICYRSTWTFHRRTDRIDWQAWLTFDRQWVGRPGAPLTPDSHYEKRDGIDPPQTVPAFDDHEYKLRLRMFPFVGPAAVGIRDLPFHVAETCDPYVQGLYWTAVSDGRVGLALFNRGLMGSVREGDGGLSSVLAFSLPYVWNTRPLSGEYSFELGVLPFEGPWRQADLHRRALEYNFPPLVRAAAGEGRPLGGVWTPLAQGGTGGAILTALYPDGGRTFARFCEYSGAAAEVALQWMGRPATLTPTDLRHRPTAAASEIVRLRPWQVRTLRID